MKDPLLDCAGGGGTTVLDGSGMTPRWTSCEMSAEGGGAMTEGAGKFSFGLREASRSGAETGGGTTAAFICTGKRDNSRLAVGAGAITFAASEGVERVLSRETLGAGATTEAVSEGAVSTRSRETRGDGGITAGTSAGATRAWSRETSRVITGEGGINAALRLGAVCV